MDWGRRDEGFALQKKRAPPFSQQSGKSAKKKRGSDEQGMKSSWDRCADGFDDLNSTIEKGLEKTTPNKTSTRKSKSGSSEKKKRVSTPKDIGYQAMREEENVDVEIDWSESGSDSEDDVIPPSPPSQTRLRVPKMMMSSSSKTSPASQISSYGTCTSSQDVTDSSRSQEDLSIDVSVPSISSGSSSVFSGKGDADECDAGSHKKGSDWLKSVQWQTPEKKPPDATTPAQVDSTRKKKKYVRGGLAEQLQRILSREKSSMAFWSHHQANNKKGNSTGSALTVRVLSLDVQCQTRVARCEVISDTANQSDTTPKTIWALFTHSTSEQLGLGVGSVIKIYPPWQKLTLPHHTEPILLCTYYCQGIGDGSTGDSDGSSQLTASLHPAEDQQQSSLTVISPKKKLQPSRLFSSSKFIETVETQIFPLTEPKKAISESFLETIGEHGGHSASGLMVKATVQRIYCRRVSGKSSLARPVRGQLPSPQTTTKQQHQWILLLQDSHKNFCELQLPQVTSTEENWLECLTCGQGREYVFSGLRVVQRANRMRSPALFSLIDSLWPLKVDDIGNASHQPGVEIQGTSSNRSPPPSFCYTVTTTGGNDKLKDTQCKSHIYKDPHVVDLQHLHKLQFKSARISVYGRIIYTRTEFQESDPANDDLEQAEVRGHHVYITNSSLQTDDPGKSGSPSSSVVYVHVRSSCCLLEVVRKSLCPGEMVFFQDLCIEKLQDGHYQTYADSCTMISKVTCGNENQAVLGVKQVHEDWVRSLGRPSLVTLPKLHSGSKQHSLVQITGVVDGIDETTAFSWPVCDVCGYDRLQGGEEDVTELHCSKCDKDVTTPVIRMNLEVFVKSKDEEESQNLSVKVQLLQNTIEKILPVSEQSDDGYDMQCILGVDIGPINCYVVQSSKDTIALEEIIINHD